MDFFEQNDLDKEKAKQEQERNFRTINDAERSRRQKVMLDEARAGRNQDMAEGRARGEQLFGTGQLGRVDATRSGDVQDIIARRKAFLSGFSPEEMNAQRDQFTEGNDRSVEMNLRRLRGENARAGVRGPVATAQAATALRAGSDAEATNQREIFLKNADAKRGALGDYEKSVSGAEATDLDKQKFNLGQMLKEKYGVAGTELGYAGLGAGERGQVLSQLLSEDQSAATIKAAESGGKK